MNVRLDKEVAIATLTLDRPDRLNAMADPMRDTLYEHSGKMPQTRKSGQFEKHT